MSTQLGAKHAWVVYTVWLSRLKVWFDRESAEVFPDGVKGIQVGHMMGHTIL